MCKHEAAVEAIQLNHQRGISVKKITILAIWLAVIMTGCGGGGSDVEDIFLPVGIDGPTPSVQLNCPGLLSSYEKITKGMNPNQVKAAFGCAPYSQSEYNGVVTNLHYINMPRGCGGYPYADCKYEYVYIYFYDFDLVFKGAQSGATNKYYTSNNLTKQDDL